MLTIVALVLQAKLPDASDVARIVSDCLVDDIPLSLACEWSPSGDCNLLDLVWSRGLRDVHVGWWSVAKLVHTEPHYYRWEFSQALLPAVRRADLVKVQWLLDHFRDCPVSKEVVNEVTEGGHLWLLQLLDLHQSVSEIEWSSSSVTDAARFGNWHLVRWLDKKVNSAETKKIDKETLRFAVETNNLEQVKWLEANGFKVDLCALKGAENATQWRDRALIFRFLLEKGYSEIMQCAVSDAAMFGDLEFLQRLARTEDLAVGDLISAMTFASERGRLSVMQWLLERIDDEETRWEVLANAMFAAAGRLEVVQWLYDQHGHDPRFIGIIRSRLTLNSSRTPMDVAASKGHLEVVQFLHRIDLSMRNKRKEPGEDGGAKSEGVLCTTGAIDGAAAAGHVHVVKWLHANRSEGCTSAAMDRVAKGAFDEGSQLSSVDQLAFLEWLNTNYSAGCTTAAMDAAAANGDLKMLQWLQANTNAECTHRAMTSAASQGRLDIMQWLDEKRLASCSPQTMELAARNGHLEVVQWLDANRPKLRRASVLAYAAGGSSGFRQKLRLVEWLLRHRPGASSLINAITWAVFGGSFEMILFLHAQKPEYNNSDVRTILADFDAEEEPLTEIRGWFEENYPPLDEPDDSEASD